MKISMISRTLMVGMLKPLNYVYQVHLSLPRLLGLLSLLSLLGLGTGAHRWQVDQVDQEDQGDLGDAFSLKVSAIEELFEHAGDFPPARRRSTAGRRGPHWQSPRPGGPAGSASPPRGRRPARSARRSP